MTLEYEAILIQAGFDYDKHRPLFDAIYPYCEQNHRAKACVSLKQAGIIYEGNERLYEILVKKGQTQKYADLFISLKKIGLEYAASNGIYASLLDSFYPKQLENDFLSLHEAGVTYEFHSRIYACVANLSYMIDNEFVKTIISLRECGFSYDTHEDLYEIIIQNTYNAAILFRYIKGLHGAGVPALEIPKIIKSLHNYSDQPIEAIHKLMNANVFYEDNKDLYHIVFSSSYANEIVDAWLILKIQGYLRSDEDEGIHAFVIKHPFYADNAVKEYIKIQQSGLMLDEKKLLIDFVLKECASQFHNKNTIEKIIDLFENYPLSESDRKKLFDLIATEKSYSIFSYKIDVLSKAFSTFNACGIFYKNSPELFSQLLDLNDAETYTSVIMSLYKQGIAYEMYKSFSLALCSNATSDTVSHLPYILESLARCGLSIEKNPEYYNINLLTLHNKTVRYALDSLHAAGYIFDDHKRVYDFFLPKNDEHVIHQDILLKIDVLKEYASMNLLVAQDHPEYQIQIKTLNEILEQCMNPLNNLLQGPLNKSKGTIKFEKVLKSIASLRSDYSNLISYNELGHYMLNLPQQGNINLSILIRNANLTQLELDEHCANSIDFILNQIAGTQWLYDEEEKIPPVIKLLPKIHQVALSAYFSDFYKDINRLFRMEPLEKELLLSNEDDKNMLANFLIGCLATDAINQSKYLPDQSPAKEIYRKLFKDQEESAIHVCFNDKKAYRHFLQSNLEQGVISDLEYATIQSHKTFTNYYPDITLLDRQEKLSLEVIQGRLANPYVFPALTSFSAWKDGVRGWCGDSGTVTKIQNIGKSLHILKYYQQEVTFTQGEQVITQQGPHYLLSTLVNTPSLGPGDHYFSETALIDVFKLYLSKEYKEEVGDIEINGQLIARPNHGLAHTYRVMNLIECVIDYFSEYANDLDFREFCLNIKDVDIEWLRVAAAFSVVGRQSEINSKEEPKRYEQYRQASAESFIYYIKGRKRNINEVILERVAHVIRYMGNPHYEEINTSNSEIERNYRNYYHRILTIAHKLDLPRCYFSDDFNRAIQLCRDLSVKSDAQHNKLSRIIRYNIELIKAHGDALRSDISPNGEMFDVSREYQAIFAEASLSFKRLIELTQTVSHPKYINLLADQKTYLESYNMSKKQCPDKRKREDEGLKLVSSSTSKRSRYN